MVWVVEMLVLDDPWSSHELKELRQWQTPDTHVAWYYERPDLTTTMNFFGSG